MWTTPLRLSVVNSLSAKHLYKQLVRECKKLPKDAQPYYVNFIRQVVSNISMCHNCVY